MLLLAGSQAIAYIDRVNFAVVGPELIRVYHYTPAHVGLLLSTFNWAFTCSLLAAGPLTDRIRPRRSYPLGVGIWSLRTSPVWTVSGRATYNVPLRTTCPSNGSSCHPV